MTNEDGAVVPIAKDQHTKEKAPQVMMMKKDSADVISKDESTEEKLSQTKMTNEDGAVPIAKGQAPEEKPFQVVLIDIKKAAEDNVIHCIETPLMGSGDLKYVAISYRWGELHETTVDTQLGYLASITSFGLDSLFKLCRTMTKEVDLKNMDYVWVDAICVNQGDYEKRKATIYQMTNIYERANYVVAVPDLHLRHLESMSKNYAEIIQGSIKYSTYIYHLIHGNRDLLKECDAEFLDEHRVPDDLHLRYLLTRYTEHFVDGFTTCKKHDEHYNAELTLDHIFETNVASHNMIKHRYRRSRYRIAHKYIDTDEDQTAYTFVDLSNLHKCDTLDGCPLTFFGTGDMESDDAEKHETDKYQEKWKRVIPERTTSIRQSMDLLSDLIHDWSTRVWVISEYHIAKKKSKHMKYWFIQLSHASSGTNADRHRPYKFFEVDFLDDAINSGSSINLIRSPTQDSMTPTTSSRRKRESRSVFQTFHYMVEQLNNQTFLEKMLKSKASRNEDRMHAILPLSEYKHKLVSKEQVGRWHINDLISVKLQLYHWTTTKDKWQLLFLSNFTDHVSGTLPTFATSNIVWPGPETYPTLTEDDQYKCNFDLTRDDSIQLTGLDPGTSIKKQYKLTIKPKEYYQHNNYQMSLLSGGQRKDEAMLRRLIQLDFPTDLPDMICIPNFTGHFIQDDHHPMAVQTKSIYLIGCSTKNKWILKFECDFQQPPLPNLQTWERHACDVTNALAAGFDIY